jgi:hypothetical protein
LTALLLIGYKDPDIMGGRKTDNTSELPVLPVVQEEATLSPTIDEDEVSCTTIMISRKLKTAVRVTLLLCWIGLNPGMTVAQEADVVMPQRGLCAHRGCMDTHPENTLPAFREAIRLGAQMIEFDIQLTRDSILVLMHDETVDRTTNGHGRVGDLTFAEIRKLDAGGKKARDFVGTAIPTFEETLAMMPRNVWLNCHLKGDEAVGRAAAAMVARSGRMHQAFLTCGEKAARGARAEVPDILICNGENRYRTKTLLYADETIRMNARFIQLLRATPGEDRKEVMEKLRQNNVTM